MTRPQYLADEVPKMAAELVALRASLAAAQSRVAALEASRDEWRKNAECYRKERDAVTSIADTLARGEQAALARVEATEVALRDIVACEDLCHLCAAQARAALASPPPHDGEGGE